MRRVAIQPVATREREDVATALAESIAEVDRGEEDKALLRELTNGQDLRDNEQDAFDDMLDRLARGKVRELSGPQRDWATRVAERVGLSVDRSADNAAVPRGREVPPPEQLTPDALKRALLARRASRPR